MPLNINIEICIHTIQIWGFYKNAVDNSNSSAVSYHTRTPEPVIFVADQTPIQCNQQSNLIIAKLYLKISYIKYFKVELFVTIS